LEGVPLQDDERAENMRRQAIEGFKVFLAQKIDFVTRTELLWGADYFWQETGPAVRFEVDGRAFVLAKKEDGTCCLNQKDGDSMAVLLADDKQFEDRLLVAVGSMLENGSIAA
jgi:hypothetical protein